MAMKVPDLIYCIPDKGCVVMSQQFAVWEVVATALISAVTILLSIALSKRATAAQLRRERNSERRERRAQTLTLFADFGAALTLGVGNADMSLREESIKFKARMFAYVDEDDEQAADWMTAVVQHMIDAAYKAMRTYEPVSFPLGMPVSVATDENRKRKGEAGSAAAREIHVQRVTDLRGWVQTTLPWEEYLESVEAEPLPREAVVREESE